MTAHISLFLFVDLSNKMLFIRLYSYKVDVCILFKTLKIIKYVCEILRVHINLPCQHFTNDLVPLLKPHMPSLNAGKVYRLNEISLEHL